MFLNRAWAGTALGLTLVVLSTGCTNTVKQQRDSAVMQNKQLETKLATQQQTLDQTQAELAATKTALAQAQQNPTPADNATPGGPGDMLGGGGPVTGGSERTRGRTASRDDGTTIHATSGRTQHFEIAGDVAFASGRSALAPPPRPNSKNSSPPSSTPPASASRATPTMSP